MAGMRRRQRRRDLAYHPLQRHDFLCRHPPVLTRAGDQAFTARATGETFKVQTIAILLSSQLSNTSSSCLCSRVMAFSAFLKKRLRKKRTSHESALHPPVSRHLSGWHCAFLPAAGASCVIPWPAPPRDPVLTSLLSARTPRRRLSALSGSLSFSLCVDRFQQFKNMLLSYHPEKAFLDPINLSLISSLLFPTSHLRRAPEPAWADHTHQDAPGFCGFAVSWNALPRAT